MCSSDLVVKYVGKSVYMDERSVDFAKSLPITVGKLKLIFMTFFRIVDIAVNLFRQVLAIIWEILKLPMLLLVFGLTQIIRLVLFIVTVSLATTISIFLKMRYCFVRFLLLGPMLVLSGVLWLLAFFVKLLRGSFVPPTFPVSLKEVFRNLTRGQ